MYHTAKKAVARRGMLAGIETKWKGALVLLVNGTWKRELFSMTVQKRSKTGSWRVVLSLIQLFMVMENRPVDPGSIPGSLRPISFIRIKHRTRADDILCKTINNHIVGLVDKNHTRYYTNASDVPGSLPLGKLSFNYSNGCTHSVS